MFADEVIEAIRADAVARFPQESCGLVTADGYQPFPNVAADPTLDFDLGLAGAERIAAGPPVLAVVHSHTNGRDHPSATDCTQQALMGIPWGIVLTDGEAASTPFFWGDGIPDVPLIGRNFRWGPTGTDGKGDCFALVRDYYRTQLGVLLPDMPRDSEWQKTSPLLYENGWRDHNFEAVNLTSLRPGGVLLCTVRHNGLPNHAAIWLGDGKILHHQENRLSVEEFLSDWRRCVVYCVQLREG